MPFCVCVAMTGGRRPRKGKERRCAGPTHIRSVCPSTGQHCHRPPLFPRMPWPFLPRRCEQRSRGARRSSPAPRIPQPNMAGRRLPEGVDERGQRPQEEAVAEECARRPAQTVTHSLSFRSCGDSGDRQGNHPPPHGARCITAASCLSKSCCFRMRACLGYILALYRCCTGIALVLHLYCIGSLKALHP